MKNAAKTADLKLSHLEPGKIVCDLSGARYRIVSKVAGPDGSVVKLSNLQGEVVSTPANLTPVGIGMARFAATLRYHLAYDKNLDKYIAAYCDREGLPLPVGPDGQPFRWADWFQSWFAPRLRVSLPNPGEAAAAKDQAIVDMINIVLGERDVLSKFKTDIKKFHKDIRRLEKGRQLTVFLVKTFKFRFEIAQNLLSQRPEEVSMIQPTDDPNAEGEEWNILDTEEHAHLPKEFQTSEAERDVTKLREGFSEWLKQKLSPKAAQWFIMLFDIYWEWVTEEGEGKSTEAGRPTWMPARRELEPRWEERTGLNKASLYAYIGRMADLLGTYIKQNRAALGDTNLFVTLLNQIEEERESLKSPKKRKQKQKSMPAHAALASLEIAQVASTNSNCVFIEFKPGEWYYILEDYKYDDEGERFNWMDFAKAFGPFKSFEEADQHLTRNHANPGGSSIEKYREGRENDEQLNRLIAEAPKNTKDYAKDRWASTQKTAREVSGAELTPEMRQQVLDHFAARWTADNPKRLAEWPKCDECDINQPFVGGDASGHSHPTVPMITDEEWIQQHKFHFYNDGRLNLRSHAEPMRGELAVASKTAEFGENVFPPDLPTEDELMSEGEKMDRDHLYCPECRECVTCNLHPCRNGMAHQPGAPLDKKLGGQKEGAAQLQCCGGWHNRHKPDCKLYNDNFDKTIETLKTLPKRSAVSEDLADAAENVLQARADQMLTPQDWDLLNDALRYADKGPLETASRALLLAHDGQSGVTAEWEAVAQALAQETGLNVGWRSHDEVKEASDHEPESYENARAAEDKRIFEENNPDTNVSTTLDTFKPRGSANKWSVTLRDAKGGTRTETVSGENYNSAERAVKEKMNTGETIVSMGLAHAKGATGEMSSVSREEYPQWFQVADALGGEVHPFDEYQGPYVLVPGIGKFWVFDKTGDSDFVIYNEMTGKESPINLYYDGDDNGIVDGALQTLDAKKRMLLKKHMEQVDKDRIQPALFKDGAGPLTPQQMQQQNVQHSQGVAVPAQPQQPVPEDQQQPTVAIMPESGTGEDQPMKKTVPPELPNARFHMSSEKSSILLDKKKHFENASKAHHQM